MEENMSSKGSSGVDNASTGSLDSNGDCYPTSPNKHLGHGGNKSVNKFKGIVPQQNGSLGSQIYANGRQIWLGTIKTQKEAAMAYDSAAIQHHCGDDSHQNFPWTNITVEEPNFQSQYSQEAGLETMKNGSCQPKFQELLRVDYENTGSGVCGLNFSAMQKRGGFSCKLLFQKPLTLSDVGRLNRLVIPKKMATTCFSEISQGMEEDAKAGVIPDMQVDFFDRMMRPWKFRYCYWKSSQSYVFTKGWSRFVKDKQLKVNDAVAFYLCEVQREGNIVEKFFMIDPVRGEDCGSSSSVIEFDDHNVMLKPELSIFEGSDHNVELKPDLFSSANEGTDHNFGWEPELRASVFEGACHNVGLRLEMRSSVFEGADHHVELKPQLCSDIEKNLEEVMVEVDPLEEEMMDVDPPSNVERKGFRLFGVQIN